MIRQLTGYVTDTTDSTVVLSVQGVGYLVHTTLVGTQLARECEVTLWTHLAVRENALDLYGFTTRDDLDLFELLLGLPKIGPKTALQIMSQADSNLIRQSVVNNDSTSLSKLSGLGKKTAEKVVAGLQEKLSWAGTDATNQGDTTPVASAHHEVIDTLIALGYSPQEARAAASALPETIASTSEGVTLALKQLQ